MFIYNPVTLPNNNVSDRISISFNGHTLMFQFLRRLFRRKKSKLGGELSSLWGKRGAHGELFEKMERLFIEADLGVATSQELVEQVEQLCRTNKKLSVAEVKEAVKKQLLTHLRKGSARSIELRSDSPTVLFMVGVNGNGKTTSVAKLAYQFHSQGKRVLLGAADTFRAAAGEQLNRWAERLGVEIVKQQPGGDPAAVVHDTLSAGMARNADLVLIDTAGRLHTKGELMRELEKMRRVASKVIPGAPHETFLVVDATTGQNGLEQARVFHQSTPITGLVLTKMDGTAKGGIAVRIQQELGIPIRYIGIGEGMEDLRPFDPVAFTESLVG
jgi:fused signal recognition particle receptor